MPDGGQDLRMDAMPDLGAEPPGWTQIFPANPPSSRNAYQMAYDSQRDKVVLFGGYIQTSMGAMPSYKDSDETWELDGKTSTWTQRIPTKSPPARSHFGITYDSKRGQTVVFGGTTIGGNLLPADTWLWDGNAWTSVTQADGPQGRENPGIVYDGDRDRIVFFGGSRDQSFTCLNDTWEWDGESRKWTQKTPPMPMPEVRSVFRMVYDAKGVRTLLLGGSATRCSSKSYSDTWTWDGSTWQKQSVNGFPTNAGADAVASNGSGRIVMFGNRVPGIHAVSTWDFDGANWTERKFDPLPSSRFYSKMVYDSLRKHFVLFGGRTYTDADEYSSLNDTWIYQ